MQTAMMVALKPRRRISSNKQVIGDRPVSPRLQTCVEVGKHAHMLWTLHASSASLTVNGSLQPNNAEIGSAMQTMKFGSPTKVLVK